MVKWFLRHEWLARTRSSFWQKSLGINILLGILAAYLALNFLALGFLLPRLLREALPGQAALVSFNAFVLYYLLLDLIVRFFMQEFPIVNLQRYLLLPVRKRQLFHFLLLKSILNFFNLLPLFFLLPFFFLEVLPTQPLMAGIAWLALMLTLVLINHYLSFYIKRIFGVRPLLALGLLAVLIGLFYLDIKEVLPLSDYFLRGIQGLIARPYWLVLPLGVLTGLYAYLFRVFGRFAYLDALSERGPRGAETGQSFALLDRFGRLGKILQLDLRLIRRNKRPRTMMIMAVILLLYPTIFDEILRDSFGFTIFIGVVTTGMAMATYGQFLLSWESSFFDLLMGRNFSMRDYFEAKFFLFLGLNGVAGLLSLLYGFLDWKLATIFLAVALYNIGVNAFITMFFSTFNTKRIDPERGAFFNYQGVGATQFLYTVPLFLGPILIYLPFSFAGAPWIGIAIVAVLGIAGILMRERLTDVITRQFYRRKYRIMAGFKTPE